MSQRALAERANLVPGYVQRLESGERPRCEAWALLRVAQALHVSLDWLLTGEGVAPNVRLMDFPPALTQAIAQASVRPETLHRIQGLLDAGASYGPEGWTTILMQFEREEARRAGVAVRANGAPKVPQNDQTPARRPHLGKSPRSR
jgi:transcriptional regulator with XRE-family HTH domain